MHINFKEAVCITLAAERWVPLWANKQVYVYSDNVAAFGMINKGSIRNALMMQRFRRLFWLSATLQLPAESILHPTGVDNTIADHVSRLDESSHFTAFLGILQSGLASSPDAISALAHMSLSSYYF